MDLNPGHHVDPEQSELFNVTPMVDVVFILLAFFVLTMRFIGVEHDLGLSHEADESSPVQADARDLPPALRIELRRGPDAVPLISVGQLQLAGGDFESLRAHLDALDLPEMPVTIAADPLLSVDVVARAVEAAMQSPQRAISLTALKPTTGGER